jgi:hypothetical protein
MRVDGHMISGAFGIGEDHLYFPAFQESGETALLRIRIDSLDQNAERAGTVHLFLDDPLQAAGDTIAYSCVGPDSELRVCVGDQNPFEALEFTGRRDSRLAGDREGAYWTDLDESGETIHFSPVGGQPRVIVDGQIGIDFLALDQSFIYWASREHGYVRRALKDGLAPEVLATNQGHIAALVADGDELFWSVEDGPDRGHIVRLRAGANEPETVIEDVRPIFAVGPDKIYFSDYTNIYALPR